MGGDLGGSAGRLPVVGSSPSHIRRGAGGLPALARRAYERVGGTGAVRTGDPAPGQAVREGLSRRGHGHAEEEGSCRDGGRGDGRGASREEGGGEASGGQEGHREEEERREEG